MAYDTEKLYEKALKLIESEKLYFVTDLIAFLGISESTFYLHFPNDSKQSQSIKDKLLYYKNKEKIEIRKELRKGRGSELIALYKLLANESELMALNSQYNKNENTHKFDTDPFKQIRKNAGLNESDNETTTSD